MIQPKEASGATDSPNHMKVYLYEVNLVPSGADLPDHIRKIAGLSLEERVFMLNGGDMMRMEAMKEEKGLFLCDFSRLRLTKGPGKASLTKETEGFDLAEDEGFAEESAILYDSNTGWMVAQYNHFGCRPEVKAEYLGNAAGGEIHVDITPRLDDEVYRKLAEMTLFRAIELKVAGRQLTEEDVSADISLENAANMAKGSGADKVLLSLSVEGSRSRSLDSGTVTRLLKWVKKVVTPGSGRSEGIIDYAKVRAKIEDDGPTETLDLVAERIHQEFEIKPGPDKRLPRETRWKALQKAHKDWANLMEKNVTSS